MRFVIPVVFYDVTNVQCVYWSDTAVFVGTIFIFILFFYFIFSFLFNSPPQMPPHVLMNFRGFPPGCGDSVADF